MTDNEQVLVNKAVLYDLLLSYLNWEESPYEQALTEWCQALGVEVPDDQITESSTL